jgi:peptidoglycan/LPS O-acetylase OafA/YrhL
MTLQHLVTLVLLWLTHAPIHTHNAYTIAYVMYWDASPGFFAWMFAVGVLYALQLDWIMPQSRVLRPWKRAYAAVGLVLVVNAAEGIYKTNEYGNLIWLYHLAYASHGLAAGGAAFLTLTLLSRNVRRQIRER